MLGRRKKTLTAEVDALREEVRELRQAVEGVRRPAPLPGSMLPGEGEVIEMIVEDATRFADERDDLARQLRDAKRELAEMEKRKPAS
jgi:prefoldin subunit 5